MELNQQNQTRRIFICVLLSTLVSCGYLFYVDQNQQKELQKVTAEFNDSVDKLVDNLLLEYDGGSPYAFSFGTMHVLEDFGLSKLTYDAKGEVLSRLLTKLNVKNMIKKNSLITADFIVDLKAAHEAGYSPFSFSAYVKEVN